MSVYVRDDLAGLGHLAAGPAAVLLRAHTRSIRHRIAGPPEVAAQRARAAVQAGAEELLITTADDLATILAAVDDSTVRLAFGEDAASVDSLAALDNPAGVELGVDPIGDLIAGRRPCASRDAMLQRLAGAATAVAGHEGAVPFAVDAGPIHRAGADPATELAASIATGIEYLRAQPGGRLCFRFPVGTRIYEEIAKLRAARLLWAAVQREFGDTAATRFHAESSTRTLSSEDVHTNLVRTSIQAFAAVLADCDSLTLRPFEATDDAGDDAFAQTLAIHQQLLLREESLLRRVQDPCAGSYATETLTSKLATAAWSIVREIERRGGMFAALQDGYLQEQTRTAAAERLHAVHARKRSLVGTNRYVDPKIARSEAGEPDTEAPDTEAQEPGADGYLAEPFLELAPDGAAFEALQALVRASAHSIQPILAGAVRPSRARFEFARDVFVAGGFDVHTPRTLDGAPEPSDADYVALCADDDALDSALAKLRATFEDARILVVASTAPESSPATTLVSKATANLALLRDLYLRLHPDTEEVEA